MEKATFAAGCFWGVEAKFCKIDGVVLTQVGYTGGYKENPTYEEVCSDLTGHAEAIEITFDPEKISYKELLEVFWNIHNPTTVNRQGLDIGSQYRSAIFFHNEEQQKLALKSKKELEESSRLDKPIVTEILPAAKFWRAEEYHQQYYEKTGRSGC
ncbi:MAG: peptide-methionine (S)-S-oxide reductase [Candidatus Melainabacteria bacterium GWA2_34_9]|nr:MAG: peptide-methionine (S)-S-oxide reductase [Candidatus Melainabacteria bacterium GWA2_34_9]